MKKLIPAALLLACAGCIESALNPTDKVVMNGQALGEDGKPLASTDVKLKRSGTSACLILSDFDTLKTDANGNFTKQMIGSDTQSDDHKIARCFELALPAGEKGSLALADFLVQVTEVKVPTLQRWSGGVTATATATGADFTFKPITDTQSQFSNVTYAATATAGGAVIWRKEAATSPVSFSNEVLEDFQAPVANAVAAPELKGSGTTFHYVHQTDGATLPQGAKVPASRGATCAYNKAPTACPLTDGKAVVNLFDTVTDITVSLQAPKTIKKIVLRNLIVAVPSTLVLESSMDGTTFTKVMDLGTGAFQELDLPAGTQPAKHYRIKGSRTDNGTFNIVQLDEVSLFE